jgi:hypothetical protein
LHKRTAAGSGTVYKMSSDGLLLLIVARLKKSKREYEDEMAQLGFEAAQSFVSSPGGDDKMVDVDFAEYPAEAFDSAAFVNT